ncbi:MAG: sigma-54-dependent Fis family transcriptional regulator, partial [Deltaproteobacteria bacterium]
ITIELPPLRERKGDIPLLAFHFLRKYNARCSKNMEGIDPDALEALERHDWPGNVRELENVIERAVVLGREKTIRLADLPDCFHRAKPPRRTSSTVLADLPYKRAKELAIAEFDRKYLTEVMIKANNNVSQAARIAGMDRSNFRRILKKYGLNGSQSGNGNSGGASGQER